MTARPGAASMQDGAVLVTGATGFLGLEVLTRLIDRTDRPIFAIVRAPDDRAADERLRDLLRRERGSGEELDGRVVAVDGDSEQPGVVLDEGGQ